MSCLFFRSLLVVLGLLWGTGAAGGGGMLNTSSDFQVYNLAKGDFIKDKLEGVLFSSPPLGYPSSKLEFAFNCGVWNGAVGMLGGLPSSASWLIKMITNEDETRTKTWTSLNGLNWEGIKKLAGAEWDKFNNANACVKSHAAGKVGFDVATIALAWAKVGKASQALNALDKLDAVGQSLNLLLKVSGKALKPIILYGGKSIKFVAEVGWAFVRPIKSNGQLYSVIIPIPNNLSGRVERAYLKAKELLAKDKTQGGLDETDIQYLKNEDGSFVLDADGNKIGELSVDIDGSPERVTVLQNDDEGMLEGMVQGAGNWQTIKNSIANRIAGKQGWTLKYTDNEIQEILTHGKGLNLPESEIEDIILNGCRPDKSFTKADLISQSNFWNTVKQRGYPNLFQSLQEYEQFSTILKNLATEWNLPVNSIYTQGSSLRISNVADIGDLDIAIKVDAVTFDKLVERFQLIAKDATVKARIGKNGKIGGVDMKKGMNIQGSFVGEFYPKFETVFGQSFKSKLGVSSIQISIVKEGSSIDVSPFLKLK